MEAHWLTDMRNITEDEKVLAPFFYNGSQLDRLATMEFGREIYKPAVFIRIRNPNDRTVVNDRIATIDESEINPDPRADNIKYPHQWARFKRNESQEAVGTPLRELPMFSRSIVDTYSAAGIVTLEQLAKLSDDSAKKLPQGYNNRQKANDLIAQATGAAGMLSIRADLDAKTAEIEELKKALKEQAELLSKKGKAAPRAEE